MPNLIRRIQKPTNQDIFVYYIVSSLLMFVCTLTHLSPFASQSSEIGTFSLCYKTWCTESMGSIQKRYNHLSKENKYDTRACQPARQTDRQTDRQTASQTVRQSDSQTVRQPDSQTARQPTRHKQTDTTRRGNHIAVNCMEVRFSTTDTRGFFRHFAKKPLGLG